MFFLTLAAVSVAVAAETQASSLNSRRDFRLERETVEEQLYVLIASDTQFYKEERKSGQLQSLQERSKWLIRIFEIGLAEDKKLWEKKRDTLRFFRENRHLFSRHTDYVTLANQIPVQLEKVAEKLAELGYEPLNTLKMAYTMAFTDYWLRSSKETQLEILREAIRPAKYTDPVITSTITTSTTTRTMSVFSRFPDLPDSDEDMSMEKSVEESELESPGEMSLPIAEEVVATAGSFSVISRLVPCLVLTVIVGIL